MNNTWSTTTKYAMSVGLFFAGLILLYIFRSVGSLLILAALIAFLLRPVIRFFQRRLRMPRGLAIGVAHVLVIVVLLALPLLLLPSVINAINFVAELDFQAFADQIVAGLKDSLASLRSTQVVILGLNLSDQLTPLIDSLNTVPKLNLPEPISYPDVIASVGSTLASSLGLAVDVMGSAASAVIAFFMMIVASMYLSRDAHLLRKGLLNHVPTHYQPEVTELLNRLGAIWGNFLKGELLVMVIIGSVVALGGLALGLPGGHLPGHRGRPAGSHPQPGPDHRHDPGPGRRVAAGLDLPERDPRPVHAHRAGVLPGGPTAGEQHRGALRAGGRGRAAPLGGHAGLGGRLHAVGHPGSVAGRAGLGLDQGVGELRVSENRGDRAGRGATAGCASARGPVTGGPLPAG